MNLRAFSIRHLLFGLLVLTCLCLGLDRVAMAGRDGGGGDANRDLIAVTGSYGSGASALYLIDSKTRQMAVYRIDGGRGLELVAARDCSYDFFIESYGDRSNPSVTPQRLRQAWDRHLKQGGQDSFAPRDEKGGSGGTTGPSIEPIEGASGSEPGPSGRVSIPRK